MGWYQRLSFRILWLYPPRDIAIHQGPLSVVAIDRVAVDGDNNPFTLFCVDVVGD